MMDNLTERLHRVFMETEQKHYHPDKKLSAICFQGMPVMLRDKLIKALLAEIEKAREDASQ